MIGTVAAVDAEQLAHRVLEGALSQQGGGGGMGGTLVMLLLMVGVFYLMLWRPQAKQAKQHREMLAALKKGDTVVTNGGIVAKVHLVAPKYIVLEAARDVRIRVLPNSITGKAPEGLLEEQEAKVEGEAAKEK